MEPTIFWAIVGIIAIIIILILGYQVWQRNNSSVSSRRSRKRSLVDERMQYSRSQQENGSSVGELKGPKPSPKGYSAHNPIQTGSSHQGNTADEWSYPPKHPQTENTGDEQTHLGSSQKGNTADEQTHIKRAGKRNVANKQTYIGSSQKGDSADEQTYMGRNRNKNVMPEDDRTVF
jgi:FtsZ-interacting cell division protein ZipA